MTSWMQSIKEQSQPKSFKRLLGLLSCALLLFVLAGCQTTKVDKWKPVRSQHKNQVHTVTWKNENLQVISKWYTGTEKNWKAIANANPNILPSRLNPGDRIFIPSSLLKTRAAMTKAFVEEWRRSAKQRQKPAEATSKGGATPLIVPKLHKLKQDEDGTAQKAPLDLAEPDDSDDLELFGPK